MNDDDLLKRVHLADPLRDGPRSALRPDPTAILSAVLAHPRRPARRGRVRPRMRTVLLVGLTAGVLAAPAAVALRLFNGNQGPPRAAELRGAYSATVSGLRPGALNGHWTISFSPYAPGYARGATGDYTLSRNRKLVAGGGYTSEYNVTLGQMVALRDTSGPSPCIEIITGGIYVVRFSGSRMTLKPNIETCVKRRLVLSGHEFEHGK